METQELISIHDRMIALDKRFLISGDFKTEFNLVIFNMTAELAGTYECRLHILLPFKQVHVEVIPKPVATRKPIIGSLVPQIIYITNDIAVIEGSTIKLTCNVSDIGINGVKYN